MAGLQYVFLVFVPGGGRRVFRSARTAAATVLNDARGWPRYNVGDDGASKTYTPARAQAAIVRLLQAAKKRGWGEVVVSGVDVRTTGSDIRIDIVPLV
jgi:hypothetical protein